MNFFRFAFCFVLIFAFSVFAFGQNGKIKAQDFRAVSMNGETVELSALKGKVVVLTFWSTRCGACQGVIPKLNRIAKNYQNENVVFLALTSENPANVANYLRKNTFDFKILPNTFDVVLKYGSKGGGRVEMPLPAHFVVNQYGEVVMNASGFSKTGQLDAEISRLLRSRQFAEE